MQDTTAPPAAPPNVEWHVFDHDNKKATAPPRELADELLWIVETFYYDGGVTLGYFDGFTFRTQNGSDDCSVSHWAEIDYPEPPEGHRGEGEADE